MSSRVHAFVHQSPVAKPRIDGFSLRARRRLKPALRRSYARKVTKGRRIRDLEAARGFPPAFSESRCLRRTPSSTKTKVLLAMRGLDTASRIQQHHRTQRHSAQGRYARSALKPVGQTAIRRSSAPRISEARTGGAHPRRAANAALLNAAVRQHRDRRARRAAPGTRVPPTVRQRYK